MNFPGEFGIVYHGILQQHQRLKATVCPVAVKTLKGILSVILQYLISVAHSSPFLSIN